MCAVGQVPWGSHSCGLRRRLEPAGSRGCASITDSAAATWRSRGYRLLPGLQQLRGYQRAWLRWDILAGLTVAAYLVPQVMAYGVLAGLPPVAGLWAAIPSLALYAFIGSSRQLSVGPESTCAIMTAVVVAPLAAGNPGRYAELAAALAVLVGLLAVVGWLLRLGFVGDLLSGTDSGWLPGRHRRHHDRRAAWQGHRRARHRHFGAR